MSSRKEDDDGRKDRGGKAQLLAKKLADRADGAENYAIAAMEAAAAAVDEAARRRLRIMVDTETLDRVAAEDRRVLLA